eukprot:COSAG01_NODE_2_length_63927_cov_1357.611941_20_plen_88_part_00
MTAKQQPFYYQKLTQSAYRNNAGPDTSQVALDCDMALPTCTEEERRMLKDKIKVEVKAFVRLLLSEEQVAGFNETQYLKALYSRLEL